MSTNTPPLGNSLDASIASQVSLALLVVNRDLRPVSQAGVNEDASAAFRSSGDELDPVAEHCIRAVFATGAPILGRMLAAHGGAGPQLRCSFLPVSREGHVHQVQILIEPCSELLVPGFEDGERAKGQLAAIIESAQDGIISKSLDGIVQSWNPSAERMFGYRADEMVGRNITTLIPEDLMDEESYILERIRRGQSVQPYETTRLHKDGHRICVSLTVSPVRDAQGKIIGASKIVQDVTARRATERALRRREEELKIVTDAIPALISYIDADLRYRFNNLAYERWFGHAPGALAGRHMRDVLGDAAFEAVRPYTERALAGEAVRFETWADYRDGGRRYIDASYLPRRDGQGRVEGFFVLVSDLTARKQAEERLCESEARYRTLINSLSDAIVLADAQRRIVLANPAFTTVFGYTADEAIGHTTEMLYADPEDYQRLGEERFHPGASGEVAAYEIHYRRKDGTTFCAETRGSAVRDPDGAVVGYLGIHRDITERKRAETALRESEERFRFMTETVPDTVFTNRPDGFCDYINARWYEYTGTEPGTAIGHGWLQALHPDDRERALKTWKAAIDAEEPFECKYRVQSAGGSHRWAIARSRPLKDDQGAVTLWLGVCTDIDDLVQAQEALQESHRRKDEFLAMLAHELRNPLAPILTAVEVLQLQPERLEGKVAWAADIIQRQTQHLTHLVDDLLDIARIVSGRIQLRRTTIDVRTSASQAAENARSRFEAKGLQLHIQEDDRPLYVRADPARLTQVLDNLLENAAKYTEAGGQVWMKVHGERGNVVLEVKDTGIGIAAEDLRRVFELFEQAEPGLDRAQGGLGLGLNLVKRLVEMHGGTVEANSAGRGAGSVFSIRLPVAQPATQSPPLDTAGATNTSRSRAGLAHKVLVVDDNPDVTEALTALLHAMGHQAEAVGDGPGCLERVARDEPDLILLDLGLPGISGYETAELLRSRFPKGRFRLVALTGYGRAEDRRRSRLAGFDQHLVKPVDREALAKLLAAVERPAGSD